MDDLILIAIAAVGCQKQGFSEINFFHICPGLTSTFDILPHPRSTRFLPHRGGYMVTLTRTKDLDLSWHTLSR